MLDVAVAIIQQGDAILLTQRQSHQSFAHLWEFPGGKIELAESPQAAIVRECEEELAITPTIVEPFMQVWYQYPQSAVLLHVFTITAYRGKAEGREGQSMRWQSRHNICHQQMLPANRAIIAALHSAG